MQSVARLTVDSGVDAQIQLDHITFLDIDHFSLPLIQVGQFSVAGESVCTQYWLTAVGRLTGRLDRYDQNSVDCAVKPKIKTNKLNILGTCTQPSMCNSVY